MVKTRASNGVDVMKIDLRVATPDDKEILADLRLSAMKDSLNNIGRFDPKRARDRFLQTFVSKSTQKIYLDGVLVGFYVLKKIEDHLSLDHLYCMPKFQNLGIGGYILESIIDSSRRNNLPIRLGALKKSRSNDFYIKHGFINTHETEWDIYYEFSH
ncbi:GNAT family N-acetyltransferase [Porticoccaceae bacterium]|nr:GNAT family N-acetyltransferase [Porticoccaceae bacterium]MDC0003343.1 GNAT family N-acetyltransferase [Porticoccaceae bacterium]